MARRRHLSWAEVRLAVLDCSVLGLACVLTYWLVANVLSRIHSVSPADDLLGGLWAVIATVFVYRVTYLPFHLWALGVLIGASALAVILIGRPGDAITAGITTAVVLAVAALSPHDAWQQPVLRLADTVIGVAVGVAAAWTSRLVIHPRASRAAPQTARGVVAGPSAASPARGEPEQELDAGQQQR